MQCSEENIHFAIPLNSSSHSFKLLNPFHLQQTRSCNVPSKHEYP